MEKSLFSPFFNLTQVVFKIDKVPKVSTPPFFIIVLKLPVCFKLLYWKLTSLFLNCYHYQPLIYTYNRVLRSFSFACVMIDVVIFTACCYFKFFFAALCLFPCTWSLTRYGQIPWFKSFSIYNLAYSERRRRLSEENLKDFGVSWKVSFYMNILCN